jgi:hypothetical protein
MSAAEVDSMLAFFGAVEIHLGLGTHCLWAPLVPRIVRWDADVWSQDCRTDYMEQETVTKLLALVDGLFKGD